MLVPKLLDVRINNWTKNKSTEVEFDLSLFDRDLDSDEEVVFRFQIGDNYLSITLTKVRAVVCIYFRAWYLLDDGLVSVIEYLLTNYQLIIVGFELNFKYDDLDIQSILDSLKNDAFNYPFILKQQTATTPEIHDDGRIMGDSSLLNLLELKVYPVFDMIR